MSGCYGGGEQQSSGADNTTSVCSSEQLASLPERGKRRLFSDSSCSNTLLLARSTWLLGGLLFAPSPGHGFLSGRYRKSGI